MPTNFEQIKKWYSGKALAKIETFVIPTLRQAEEQGYWPKGVSRSVVAALSKQTEAEKFAYAHDRVDNNMKRGKNADGLLSGIREDRNRFSGIGWNFCHAMMFGQVGHAPTLLESAETLTSATINAQEMLVALRAVEWARDFTPVAHLITLLDSRRPPRKVVLGTLSPTVAANLVDGIKLDVSTVRMPPTEAKWVTRLNPKTKREEQVLVYRILWPKNTVFGATRYKGTNLNNQCEACGHAIKNPFNWVPLLVDNDKGIPHAFYVGSDCAKNLFGAEIEGEGLYEGRGA